MIGITGAKTAMRSRYPTNVGKKAWLTHLFPLIFLKVYPQKGI